MKPCPLCGEQIQDDAIKCRYCKEILPPSIRNAITAEPSDTAESRRGPQSLASSVNPSTRAIAGRWAVWLFASSYSVKALIAPKLDPDRGLVFSLLYGIPALILVWLAVTFRGSPRRAVYAALILGAIETLDTLSGIPARFQTYGITTQALLLAALRVLSVAALWNAARRLWRKEDVRQPDSVI